METMELKVGGMTCDGCERSIVKALTRLDGVRAATADHRSGLVTLEVDRAPEEAAIRDAVEDAGYEYVPAGRRDLPMA